MGAGALEGPGTEQGWNPVAGLLELEAWPDSLEAGPHGLSHGEIFVQASGLC